jgi:hypothetical protein
MKVEPRTTRFDSVARTNSYALSIFPGATGDDLTCQRILLLTERSMAERGEAMRREGGGWKKS